ncbi:MAG: SDR family oxidoreductase [Rhodospirillaceae bacterium]|nr:SDR family oxidoreductase [Rhodospirillaceae bacterium]
MTVNTTMDAASEAGSLTGKVALITGAESGIGQACAVAMARAGAAVVVTGRSEKGGSLSARQAGLLKGRAAEEGSETVRQIRDAGGNGEYLKLDVTVEDDWRRAMVLVGERYGRLDILVNNAGNNGGGPLEETSLDTALYLLRLNVEGPFLGMTHAWPLLKQARGVVLNMNSGAGQRGSAGGAAYPSAKGAQLGLSKAAAIDGRRDGIRVISLHPGGTWTPGMARARGFASESEYLARTRQSNAIPLGDPAFPADVAAVAVFLASDAARGVTGIEFNIDGGSSARA